MKNIIKNKISFLTNFKEFVNSLWGEFFVPVLFIVVFLSVSLEAKRPGFMYLAELNTNIGYHFFGQSGSGLGSKKEMLKEDIFFQDETAYRCDNASTNISDNRMGMPYFSIEWIMGIKLDKLPYLKEVNSLKGFEGFRVGAGIAYYMFTTMSETFYSGEMIYVNHNAYGTQPAEINYSGSISAEEKYFIYIPKLTFYYYHERGFIISKYKLLPYGGLELGINTITGERKYLLKTDPVVETDGNTYQASAQIQEVFFNAMSIRIGLLAGVQYHVGTEHSIDFRIGFVYSETSAAVKRTGTWNEQINDATYSRRVVDESKTVKFSQTGFQLSLGYTVGLF